MSWPIEMEDLVTTAQKTALDRAKQGCPEALASLIRKQLAGKGIQVRVSRNDDLLTIALGCAQAPQKAPCLHFLRKGLANLKVQNTRTVRVQGYKQGVVQPVWTEQINLSTQSIVSQNKQRPNRPTPTTQSPLLQSLAHQIGPIYVSKWRGYLLALLPCIAVPFVVTTLLSEKENRAMIQSQKFRSSSNPEVSSQVQISHAGSKICIDSFNAAMAPDASASLYDTNQMMNIVINRYLSKEEFSDLSGSISAEIFSSCSDLSIKSVYVTSGGHSILINR